jgi:hypothetical protein
MNYLNIRDDPVHVNPVPHWCRTKPTFNQSTNGHRPANTTHYLAHTNERFSSLLSPRVLQQQVRWHHDSGCVAGLAVVWAPQTIVRENICYFSYMQKPVGGLRSNKHETVGFAKMTKNRCLTSIFSLDKIVLTLLHLTRILFTLARSTHGRGATTQASTGARTAHVGSKTDFLQK